MARVCSLNRVSFGLNLAGTAAEMDTPPCEATDQVLRLSLRLRASPPPPAPGRRGAAGPGGTLPSAGPLQAGTVCPFAGGTGVCRSAVNRGHGSAVRSRAGPVCLIAGSLIVRRPAVNRQAGSAGRRSLPGGHSVSDRWDTTSCRAGGGPPDGICRALPGGHCVPDRWKGADSPGRGRSPGRNLPGAVTGRRAQCPRSLEERRLAGPGEVPDRVPLGAARRAQCARPER
jgi:hypothetical protein